MKILQAKNKIEGFDTINFNVNEVGLFPHIDWLQKRMPKFRESISKVGMLYPILVTDKEHYWNRGAKWPEGVTGLACHTGNKRLLWAKENGYDLIEGIFVNSEEEKIKIVHQTFMWKDSWPTEERI